MLLLLVKVLGELGVGMLVNYNIANVLSHILATHFAIFTIVSIALFLYVLRCEMAQTIW